MVQARDLRKAFEELAVRLEKSKDSVQELRERDALLATCRQTIAILKRQMIE